MITNPIDVLIFIPVIPVIPVIITWWLPWERWIPRWKIPNKVSGPYVLYCSFAAWYFHGPWWVVGMASLWAIVLCMMAVFDAQKASRLRKARYWPTAEARFVSSGR